MVKKSVKKTDKNYNASQHAGTGAVYGLGLIGALVYYLQQADSFWLVVLAFLKAIVWPAYLTYKLFELVYS